MSVNHRPFQGIGQGQKNIPEDITLIRKSIIRHIAQSGILFFGRDAPKKIVVSIDQKARNFDHNLESGIRAFQINIMGLKAGTENGIVRPNSMTKEFIDKKFISPPRHKSIYTPSQCTALIVPNEGDFAAAAKELGCETEVVKSFAQVENPNAWDSLERCKILFERHKFYKHTNGKYKNTHSDICNPKAGGYGKESEQYKKLYRAALLNEEAALKSASWGKYQIMGENFKQAGYKDVNSFVTDVSKRSEKLHLEIFVKFAQKSTALLAALKAKNWNNIARIYNGPQYEKNDYHNKLREAYEGFKKERKLER